MRIYQSILIYLLIYLTLSVLLRFFGIIHVETSEVIGYGLVFFGGASVYISFGKNQKITLFLGSIIFLIGILLFIINNFLVFWSAHFIIPSLFIIPGLAIFMLFIEDFKNKRLLLISSLLFLFGLVIIALSGQFNFRLFISSIILVGSNYWTIIIILLIIIGVVLLEERKG